MQMDQFSTLISLLPDIEEALKENGESLPRPIYGRDNPSGHDDGEQSSNQSPSKHNIEATSDEDEGEE